MTAIESKDAAFDAVFDFGAIHLVSDWEMALSEVRRLLKPGGRFFFELVTSPLLRLPYALVTEGFEQMKVPTPQSFISALERRSIRVGKSFARPRLAALTQAAGDFIGVGRLEA